MCYFLIFQYRKLIQHVNQQDQSSELGYFLSILLLVCSYSKSVLFEQYFARMLTTGQRMKISIQTLLYKKILRVYSPSEAKKENGNSVQQKMLSTFLHETQRIIEIPHNITMIWSCLFQITVATILLFQQLGVAALASLIIWTVLLVTSFYFSKVVRFFT